MLGIQDPLAGRSTGLPRLQGRGALLLLVNILLHSAEDNRFINHLPAPCLPPPSSLSFLFGYKCAEQPGRGVELSETLWVVLPWKYFWASRSTSPRMLGRQQGAAESLFVNQECHLLMLAPQESAEPLWPLSSALWLIPTALPGIRCFVEVCNYLMNDLNDIPPVIPILRVVIVFEVI